MDLVNELQVSAEKDDVLTVLRKARRLASKLQVDEINKWLDFEQNGYPDKKSVPDYRVVPATLSAYASTHVPVGWGQLRSGFISLPNPPVMTFPYQPSICELLSGVMDGNSQMCFPAPEEAYNLYQFNELVSHAMSLVYLIDKSKLRSVPEAVKDHVLNWACKLESRGIRGDGLSFSANEISNAKNVTINISHSKIEQLSNSGNNMNRVVPNT